MNRHPGRPEHGLDEPPLAGRAADVHLLDVGVPGAGQDQPGGHGQAREGGRGQEPAGVPGGRPEPVPPADRVLEGGHGRPPGDGPGRLLGEQVDADQQPGRRHPPAAGPARGVEPAAQGVPQEGRPDRRVDVVPPQAVAHVGRPGHERRPGGRGRGPRRADPQEPAVQHPPGPRPEQAGRQVEQDQPLAEHPDHGRAPQGVGRRQAVVVVPVREPAGPELPADEQLGPGPDGRGQVAVPPEQDEPAAGHGHDRVPAGERRRRHGRAAGGGHRRALGTPGAGRELCYGGWRSGGVFGRRGVEERGVEECRSGG